MRLFFVFLLLGWMMFSCDAWAEHVYPFHGHLNLEDMDFVFSVKMDQGASLELRLKEQEIDTYQAVLDVQNLQTPFFEMTTDIQSVVDVHRQNDRVSGLSGHFWSQYSLVDHKTVPEMSGRFDLKGGILRVDDFIIGDFTAEGAVGVFPPHDLDGSISFDGIGIAYFLDWLSGERKKFVGSGQMSGHVELSGTPKRLAVKSNILSDGGYIENLQYDRMALQFQGIYPVVDLTNSTITKTNGFSFDLDGTVDLSDKHNMSAQIAAIKKIPLVNENNLQSEWILKRVLSGDSAETEYFIKKDKGSGLSGEDDYGVFGVERKIGF